MAVRKPAIAVSVILGTALVATALFWPSGEDPNSPAIKIDEAVSETSGIAVEELEAELAEAKKRLASQTAAEGARAAEQSSESELEIEARRIGEFADSSPQLSAVLDEEVLIEDIAEHAALMREDGRAFQMSNGGWVYKPFDPDRDRGEPDSLFKYGEETTIEELVHLSEMGDPAAKLALSMESFKAGRWVEGEFYAIESARVAGSAEPLFHAALLRSSLGRAAYNDKRTASFFLAAYMFGSMNAAGNIAPYFRVMSEEDQGWAIVRANEILREVNQGG